MKPRNLLLACCVLLAADSILAQSAGVTADPITGTWTGHMGPGATPQFSVRLELKFDGKGAVSGTLLGLPSPGDTGTFIITRGADGPAASPQAGPTTPRRRSARASVR